MQCLRDTVIPVNARKNVEPNCINNLVAVRLRHAFPKISWRERSSPINGMMRIVSGYSWKYS
uniref:Uncharacterized protein n=1 Tax=Candidatus Kentrum sp. SD TaxID=2126332 RepID=A0A451BIB2_9GAMM|nr:MAG: hypothetical protein BECKSD772D_GA0070982_100445 [Candidatus Kentron sp. SD]